MGGSIASASESVVLTIIIMKCTQHQKFAENLFKLFDSDCSEGITMEELIGGLSQLTDE